MRHGQCCWHAIGSASTPGTTVWWMDKFQGWRQTLPSSPTTQHFSHRLLKPPPEMARLYISSLIKSFHTQVAFALTGLWMGKLNAQQQCKALSWFYGGASNPLHWCLQHTDCAITGLEDWGQRRGCAYIKQLSISPAANTYIYFYPKMLQQM